MWPGSGGLAAVGAPHSPERYRGISVTVMSTEIFLYITTDFNMILESNGIQLTEVFQSNFTSEQSLRSSRPAEFVSAAKMKDIMLNPQRTHQAFKLQHK